METPKPEPNGETEYDSLGMLGPRARRILSEGSYEALKLEMSLTTIRQEPEALARSEILRRDLRAFYADGQARLLIEMAMREVRIFPLDGWAAVFAPEAVPPRQSVAPVPRGSGAAPSETRRGGHALTLLQARWSEAITGAVRIGAETPDWYLCFGERRVRLGSTEQLFNQGRIRSRIVEVTGRLPPRVMHANLDEWDTCIEALMDCAVFEDEPETRLESQARQLVLAYLNTRHVAFGMDFDEEEWQRCAHQSQPFRRDGAVYLHCRTWHTDYLRHMTDIAYYDALVLLRTIGTNVTISLRSPKTSRYYWKIDACVIYGAEEMDSP